MSETLSAEPHVCADAATLRSIADELEAAGLEAEELRELSEELEIIERPPGLLRRVTQKARSVAAKQWENFLGELEESREAAVLIRARARGERELSDEERAKVREQLLDLVRLFPAGLIAALNTTLPDEIDAGTRVVWPDGSPAGQREAGGVIFGQTPIERGSLRCFVETFGEFGPIEQRSVELCYEASAVRPWERR